MSILGLEPASMLMRPLDSVLATRDVKFLLDGALHAKEQEDERVRIMAEADISPENEAAAEDALLQQWIDAMKIGDVPLHEIKGRHFMFRLQLQGKRFVSIAHIPPEHSQSVLIDVFPDGDIPLDARDLGLRLQQLEADLSQSQNMYHGSQLLVERLNAVLNYVSPHAQQLHIRCCANIMRNVSWSGQLTFCLWSFSFAHRIALFCTACGCRTTTPRPWRRSGACPTSTRSSGSSSRRRPLKSDANTSRCACESSETQLPSAVRSSARSIPTCDPSASRLPTVHLDRHTAKVEWFCIRHLTLPFSFLCLRCACRNADDHLQ